MFSFSSFLRLYFIIVYVLKIKNDWCDFKYFWNWLLLSHRQQKETSFHGLESAWCMWVQPKTLGPNCFISLCPNCWHSDLQSLPRSLTRRQHWLLLDIFRDTISQNCSCSDNSPTKQPTAVSHSGIETPLNVEIQSTGILSSYSNDGVGPKSLT